MANRYDLLLDVQEAGHGLECKRVLKPVRQICHRRWTRNQPLDRTARHIIRCGWQRWERARRSFSLWRVSEREDFIFLKDMSNADKSAGCPSGHIRLTRNSEPCAIWEPVCQRENYRHHAIK